MIKDSTALDIRVKTPNKGTRINTHREETAKRLQLLFTEYIGSEPRIRINEEGDDAGSKDRPVFIATQSMWHAHLAFSGGLHYPDKAGEPVYEKDDIFDHLADAARYGIFVYFRKPHSDGSPRKEAREKDLILSRKDKALEVRQNVGDKNKSSRVGRARRTSRNPLRTQILGRF
jgi:hypothetical protein